MGEGGRSPLAIRLRYYAPAADLRRLVSSYYVFRADVSRISDLMRADLGQLRFMLAGTGSYRFAGGRRVETPEICLIGPTTAATGFQVTGPLLVFGVAIHPAGWAALVREDASLHADNACDAGPVLGPTLRATHDALRDAPDAAAMCAIADAALRALLPSAAEPPLRFTELIDDWLTGEASPQVDDLVAHAGMSARQVERLTKRIYGASPKLLARKYRALRAASLLGAEKLPWADVAGDAFYDQSHFIREFKHFTGTTPNRFARDPSPFTLLTLQRRMHELLPAIVATS